MDFLKPVFGTVTITLEDPRDPAVHGGGESSQVLFAEVLAAQAAQAECHSSCQDLLLSPDI
jgi:hypothetical protein